MQEEMASLEDIPFPSASVNRCPYGYYEKLRTQAPVFKLPGRNVFVVSCHEDINLITRSPDLFSNRHSVIEKSGLVRAATPEDFNREYTCGIVNSDPPDHTWKRSLAFELFKPKRLRAHEQMIREHAVGQIGRFIDRGEVEFVEELAGPVPALVVLSLFGLSLDYLDKTLEWSAYDGMGSQFNTPEVQAAAAKSILSVSTLMSELINERAARPGEDDLSLHVQRHVDLRGRLDIESLIAETSQLFLGGTQTTKHVMTSLMMLFIRHPDHMERARRDDGYLKACIEEALRLESPVQFSLRLCRKDTELRGVTVPAGAQMLLLWGSANRDEAVFSEPETYDPSRRNVREHLAFGKGIHFCIGAALGRLETQIVFEELFKRIKSFRFAEGKNDFEVGPAVAFRAPTRLFLEFSAET